MNRAGLSQFTKSIDQKAQIAITPINYVNFMTTIAVSEEVKKKLLRVASELQIKRGRRVDLNEALSFLVDQREKNPQLLEEACKPMSGAAEVIEELKRERKIDETRLERKISRRRQRPD